MLVGLFLLLVYLVLETARASYLMNTVVAVTQRAARAAAVTDFTDGVAMDKVRQWAIFRTSAGPLALGGAIDQTYVRIDYLSLGPSGARLPVTVLPACPQENLVNCIDDPHGASCIRFVRARLCLPGAGADCAPVPYAPLLPGLASLFSRAGVSVPMGVAATVTPAASLGYRSDRASPGCAGAH